jgi:hypothetical protein
MDLSTFIDTYCEQGGSVPVNEIYRKYEEVCGRLTRREFDAEMTALGYRKRICGSYYRYRGWRGLHLKEQINNDLERAIKYFGLTPPVYFNDYGIWADGGTLWYSYRDENNKELIFCLEGRFGHKERNSAVYLSKYESEFRAKEKDILYLLTITEAMAKMGQIPKEAQPLRMLKALGKMNNAYNQ